jgi:hypothetical protein
VKIKKLIVRAIYGQIRFFGTEGQKIPVSGDRFVELVDRDAAKGKVRTRSWKRTAADSPPIGSRRFPVSGVLTFPCRIWCGPAGVLSTKKSGPAGKVSTAERHPEPAAAEATKPKVSVTYQVSEQPSSSVQEEEFAKQLRLARYLAAGAWIALG